MPGPGRPDDTDEDDEVASDERRPPADTALLDVLRTGRLRVIGRLVVASNATFLGEVVPRGSGRSRLAGRVPTRDAAAPAESDGAAGADDAGPANAADGDADSAQVADGEARSTEAGDVAARVRGRGAVPVIYKPIRGERPLWDFPPRTLALREAAAFLVSEAGGWGIVPPTVLRGGPFGRGMVQAWIDVDATADPIAMVQSGHRALRPMALFDAVVNNADRKIGHLLPLGDGHVHGVDHGICFAVAPKLRTVLWHWRGEPLRVSERAFLRRVRKALDGPLAEPLVALLAPDELRALYARIDGLLASGVFPQPDPDRPVVPWPLV
jgi:uncharacterized repeat protein (TIGR03843 family)